MSSSSSSGTAIVDEKDDPIMIKSLTSKEIKKLAKPEFAANPDKFYPTDTLKKLGFQRAQCSAPGCDHNYWRRTEARKTCGDSQCEKKYSFIGIGTGKGRGANGKKITYPEAWEGFRRSLTSARIPCTAIQRYPVVARWRDDVDFVAAGIFCFQPYVVTGELAPPANPLICPQFCLRFNDLDNIGLTGRHYSGFIMLGIQVFNKPNDYKFWSSECVEFNYRWLTEELQIDPDEITFIEDVWAGGGNLGPSIEYFVGGLELGNMVFMQYKTFPDGRREPLQVQVIDVGIGLERVPWLINGSPTSYCDVFPTALKYLQTKLKLDLNDDVWVKFGPLSSLLNVDEVDDIDKIWSYIGDQIGLPADKVKSAIEPVRDLYIVCDHTRCLFMAIFDGSLPSGVGGAANVRRVLRRVFAILKKRGWWEILGMSGLLDLFECHKKDLSPIYGEFREYKSFSAIIELEYSRWINTDKDQEDKLRKLIAKRKGALTMDDWILCVTGYGIPADTVATITKIEIPGNLNQVIAEREEASVKAVPAILYSTAHLPETKSLYYEHHKTYEFTGKILEVMPNAIDNQKPNVVVLDQSSFYPFSGGQEHDTGKMWIDGKEYAVVDVMKVGPCVLHVLNPALPIAEGQLGSWKGKEARGLVDEQRRTILRNHHTATHIVYASCRRVLGPHVWQAGAKKTTNQAHLDITHFNSIPHAQLIEIQTEANRIVQSGKAISKSFVPKDEAEKQFGFHLYQGGVVPGNELRIVNIADTDVEACCGTHCDNTSEVGLIKIIKASRISDGIVRLYYVAGDLALSSLSHESTLLNTLVDKWAISGHHDIIPTAERFFEGYKRYSTLSNKQSAQILDLQMKVHLLDPSSKLLVLRSNEPNVTLFMSNMGAHAGKFKELQKGVVFVGDSFLYGLVGDRKLYDSAGIVEVLSDIEKKEAAVQAEKKARDAKYETKAKETADTVSSSSSAASSAASSSSSSVSSNKPVTASAYKTRDTLTSVKGKDKKTGKKVTEKVTGVHEFSVLNFNIRDPNQVVEYLKSKGFVEAEEE